MSTTRTAVVIGSGFTGLVTGALLAKLGYHVRILESNPTSLGGHGRTLSVGGVPFCPGPQYVWNFGPNQIGGRVLRFLGLDERIEFEPMDPDGFARIIVGDDAPFDVPLGLGPFRQLLTSRFPQDARGLHRFFRAVEVLTPTADLLEDRAVYLHAGMKMRCTVLWSWKLSIRQKLYALLAARWSLGDLFDKCGLGVPVRRILYAHGGIFAESDEDISLMLYVASLAMEHRGLVRPCRGFSDIVDQLAAVVRENGGQVETGRRVTRLECQGHRVLRATDERGDQHDADVFVSNLSPRLTLNLLNPRPPDRLRYQPSNSLTTCFLVVDGARYGDMLDRQHIWWLSGDKPIRYDDPDMTRSPRMLFIGSTPTCGEAQPDTTALTLFAPASYTQAAAAVSAGQQAVDALRRQVQEAIVETVDRHVFPGIASHIRAAKVLLPTDVEDDTGAELGNVYGRRLTPRQILDGVGRQRWPENLRVACAAVGFPGVASAFRTAVSVVEGLDGTNSELSQGE